MLVRAFIGVRVCQDVFIEFVLLEPVVLSLELSVRLVFLACLLLATKRWEAGILLI